MTQLIVAIDTPNKWYVYEGLIGALSQAGVWWFKLGPQTAALPMLWAHVFSAVRVYDIKLFVDLKLSDTWETTVEAVTRFRDAGAAAISTSTKRSMMASASVYGIKTWHLMALSDDIESKGRWRFSNVPVSPDGIICPAAAAEFYRNTVSQDVIVTGVRFTGDDSGGHYQVVSPYCLREIGVDYAVVGRPIWQADDPVAVARRYVEALS